MPFEVPSSWVWTTVNEINMYNSKNVNPAKQKKNTFELYSVPVFPTNTPEIIKGEKIGSAKQSVENGDVLLCKINPKINRVWFVKNRTENTMIASSEWIVIRNKFMLTDYLVFCFMSPYFRDLMENNVSGVGGSLTRAQPSMVANYAIPIPPLQEQKRIITEIKHWFELIDVIDQSKECLQGTIKKAKSKILDLAIHGKLVPQDPTDEPACELLKRINPKAEITSDNGHYQKLPFKIPKSWLWCGHNDILEISGGSQPAKNHFISVPKDNYIRLYQIRDYGDNPIPVYIPEELASKRTEKGDILLARYGGSLGKVFHAETGAYNVAMAKVIFKYPNVIVRDFAYYYYLSDLYQGRLKEISRTAQAGFNSSDFNEMFFPLPPYAEQKRIVNAINKTFTILDTIMENL